MHKDNTWKWVKKLILKEMSVDGKGFSYGELNQGAIFDFINYFDIQFSYTYLTDLEEKNKYKNGWLEIKEIIRRHSNMKGLTDTIDHIDKYFNKS